MKYRVLCMITAVIALFTQGPLIRKAVAGSVAKSIAKSIDRIDLSQSFAVELPLELHAQMGFMPSLGGFWFEGSKQGDRFSIWIQRVNAPALANKFSVTRFWKDGIAQAATLGEISQDKGCRSLEKYVFGCQRLVHAKKERYAHERLIWNAQSDLVIVRVMSAKSYQEAETIADMIQMKPVTRLPASLAQPKTGKGG